MRSTAGIVAGLILVGLFATNCGGDDDDSGGPKAGAAGEGGDGHNTGATSSGGTSSSGKTGTTAGEGGMPVVPVDCTKDADCGAGKCVNSVCKLDDGEACSSDANCQNNCVDDVCTSKLPDDAACASDDECAHTCIDAVCAPVSDVGGDCDVDLGSGGAGDGSGGASVGGAGGAGSVAASSDCKAPLQCFSGKCLAPDGEACADNVDCLNTCVKNICQPKATIDGDCDDKADCAVAALVCDETSATCKLDLLQQCTDDGQCKSNTCICSNANCTVRTCKNANANCLCKWSPSDSATCTVTSANLNAAVADPRGCTGDTNNYCNQGQCVPNVGGTCTMPCVVNAHGTPDDVSDDTCGSQGAPTCNPGYHPTVTAQCAYNKASCEGACRCDLN